MILVDEATGERSVRSGAFVYDRNGCSVSRWERLRESELSELVLIDRPDDLLAVVRAISARFAKMDPVDDRWPNGLTGAPSDAAHALVVFYRGGKRQRGHALTELAAQSRLVGGTSLPY
jgi:hypothetical protein